MTYLNIIDKFRFKKVKIKSKIDLNQVKELMFHNSNDKLECITGLVKEIILAKISEQTNKGLAQIIKDGQLSESDNINLITSKDINYSARGALTFAPIFTSLFIIEKNQDKRYFILGEEYTKKAFYDFMKNSSGLQKIGEQFLAIEEKNQISQAIDVARPKANNLKI